MNIFTKVSVALCLGMFFIASTAQSAPLFSVTSNGNYLTITTTRTNTLNAGIKSDGFTFSNCTLDSNGFCRFSVSKTQSQNLLIAGPAIQPKLTLCNFPLNGNNTCITIKLGERFAYVVNYTGFSVSLCPIDSSTGELGTCTVNSVDPTFLAPMGIALNPEGTLAYVTTTPYNGGGPNSVSVCPINSDGSLGQCTLSPAYFKAPWSLTFNATGSMAYVANGFSSPAFNTISTCSINTSNGEFISCNDFSDPSFNVPAGVILNKTGTRAYITNTGVIGNGTTVSLCPVNTLSGSLSTCQEMTDPTFHGPSGITFNNNETLAYVTNYQVQLGTTISRCPIKKVNGQFKPCTTLTSPSFSGPIGIKLNKAGTLAYITENKTNRVTVCSIVSGGSFGTCTDSTAATPLFSPIGITLF